MTTQYVQFTDATQTTICSVYGCPQDPIAHPNQGTLDDTDARYTAFMNPPAPPLTATPFQFRAALTQAGLRAQVEAAVAASANQTIQDAYQFASVFLENDPFVTEMAAGLSQTPDQIHALFVLAQTLAA